MGILDYLSTSASQLKRIPQELPGLLEDWLGNASKAGIDDYATAVEGYNADGTPRLQTGRALSLLGNVMPGGPGAKGATTLGAGPVVRRDLFDYTKLHQVPDVPQGNLERNVPARGPSERVQALDDRKIVKRVNDSVAKGAKDGVPWYNTEPLRKAFIDEFGEQEGVRRYGLYMDMVAATSPRSNVGINARNASYYYQQALKGNEVAKPLPEPYGHLAANLHIQNYDNIRKSGGMGPETSFPILKNPKPPSFSQNLQGNQTPVTADTHYVRNWGRSSKSPEWLLPSFKAEKDAPTIHPRALVESGQTKMKDAPPVWWDGMPRPNEYPMLEMLGQREAKKLGMTPAQYQASAWVGAGDDTGLASGAEPFLRHFENRVMLTSEKTGIPPGEVLTKFMKGEITLLSEPGAPGLPLLDGAEPPPEREPEPRTLESLRGVL
jgi:hypothetical protein